MHMKTLISAAALTVALGFTGTAFAQAVTLGNQTVTEADMERVQVRCDDLQTEANAAVGTSDNADDATSDSSESNTEQGTEEGTAGLIELDTITLEQCMEAGLVE